MHKGCTKHVSYVAIIVKKLPRPPLVKKCRATPLGASCLSTPPPPPAFHFSFMHMVSNTVVSLIGYVAIPEGPCRGHMRYKLNLAWRHMLWPAQRLPHDHRRPKATSGFNLFPVAVHVLRKQDCTAMQAVSHKLYKPWYRGPKPRGIHRDICVHPCPVGSRSVEGSTRLCLSTPPCR